MQTTLYGWETGADKRVIEAMERRFGKPLAMFQPIRQPEGDEYGFWWCRVSGMSKGVLFVRQDTLGGLHCYGPIHGDDLHEDDEPMTAMDRAYTDGWVNVPCAFPTHESWYTAHGHPRNLSRDELESKYA